MNESEFCGGALAWFSTAECSCVHATLALRTARHQRSWRAAGPDVRNVMAEAELLLFFSHLPRILSPHLTSICYRPHLVWPQAASFAGTYFMSSHFHVF
jgi:hypothetical protein